MHPKYKLYIFNKKLLMRYFAFFFFFHTKSLESGVFFTFTAYLNLEELNFKCLTDIHTCLVAAIPNDSDLDFCSYLEPMVHSFRVLLHSVWKFFLVACTTLKAMIINYNTCCELKRNKISSRDLNFSLEMPMFGGRGMKQQKSLS